MLSIDPGILLLLLSGLFAPVRPVALLLDDRAGEIDCPDEIGVVLEEPIIVEAHDVVVAFL